MKSSSTPYPTTRNHNPHEPWRHRHFQKDKLRVQERYWRHLLDLSEAWKGGTTSNSVVVLPDGRTWRRYLPLLKHLIQMQQQDQKQQLPQNQLSKDDKCSSIHWVLLESASELMDWRNLSPCVPQKQRQQQLSSNESESFLTRESTAPRERATLLQLLESEKRQSAPIISCFCDLSVREEECDEWYFLGYSSMSIVDRSRHALVRAGRMLAAPEASSKRQNHPVILLVHDEEEKELLRETCGAAEDEDLMLLDISDFLTYSIERNLLSSIAESNITGGSSSKDNKDDVTASLCKLKELRKRCDEEYERRNTMMKDDDESDNRHDGNQEYLTDDQVQKGLRSGELVRGRLDVTRQNPREAFVTTGNQQYFVNQRLNHFNRSLDGDMVVMQRLPEAQWGRPIGRRRLVHNADDEENDIANQEEGIPAVPSGRVVAIMSRSPRTSYVATLVSAPQDDENNILVVPRDIKIPKIRIATKAWKKYLHRRLLVKVDQWDIGSTYPRGHCEEIIGPIGDLEVEIKCLLIENQIDLDPFSASALASLPSAGPQWVVPDEEIKKRRDLRKSRRIFSVDPPGCQDIDDTFHAEVLPNGDIEIGVHIADVTFFVAHNSALDLEAQKRGTTFYLVDRRFDMLPSLLSSDLCSLHGDVDRLAVSVIWTLSADFQTVRSVWYGRTVIRNCQAMTYDQAHNILHNKPPDEPGKNVPPLTAGYPVNLRMVPQLRKDLSILRDLGRKLKKTREDVGGAVDLSSGDLGGELKFSLDENGNPVAVKPKKELEIHNTVAELMIYANGYVATRIYDAFKESALLRIHRSVEQSRFDDLKNVLDVGGVSLEGNSNMALAGTLKKVDQADAIVNSLIKSLATRAMSEAQYICTGDQKDGIDLSHYGLGVDRYTHFTSPIRRYADVVVHKQLLASLELEEVGSVAGIDKAAKDFAKLDRPALPTIPDSNVISIMAGEGVDGPAIADVEEMAEDDFDPDGFLDSLIEGASELALGVTEDAASGVGELAVENATTLTEEIAGSARKTVTTAESLSEIEKAPSETTESGLRPYGGSEVIRIAESLNTQNRMAKHSSMECQNLFLSLYFRDHEEITQGVVTDLRENGCYVYIPKFDISGPVYLRDMDGAVQIDPSLLGLADDAGQPPTHGFAGTSCRRFRSGQCTLVESPDESPGSSRLEVSVSESKQVCTIRTVDVVSIRLRCDDWDVRSRVPLPRFQLVMKGSRPPPGFGQHSSSTTKKITSKVLTEEDSNRRDETSEKPLSAVKPKQQVFSSLFDALQSIEIRPVLEGVPFRSRKNASSNNQEKHRQETFKGRLIFHQFVNPDTKSATQEAAMSAASQAAAQRRTNAVQTADRRNEYDSARRIENNIMARAQRLAADKRNTRRGKGS